MREIGVHKPTFAHIVVRIHSLMIYSEIVEFTIAGNTKTPLLRCFPFISKLKLLIKSNRTIRELSNLQSSRLLKNSFHSIHIDLRHTFGEKISFVSVGITRLLFKFRKVSDNHLSSEGTWFWCSCAGNWKNRYSILEKIRRPNCKLCGC